MSWLARLKEKAQEHTILGLFGLIALLSLIVWRAVPSAVWDRVSEAVPKRALWALAGLLAIAAIGQAAYIFSLRKVIREKFTPQFGLLWNKQKIPYCPSCEIPLTQVFVGTRSSIPAFKCIKCKGVIVPRDSEGERLSPADAIKRMASNELELLS